jgi:uncharacterized protein
MKPTKQQIAEFLAVKTIAVAGVSRNEKKFGATAYKELKERGYRILPVNPNTPELYGETCYPSVGALPAEVTSLLIVTPKTQTLGVLKEAVGKGIRNIWIQQMSENAETIEYVKTLERKPVIKQCILMHAEPVKGFHKFHRTIYNFFGVLPK